MKVNLNYLKHFVSYDKNKNEMKELLASIGVEVDEILDYGGETVFDVEITPNRPDWLSHYGIAREIAAKDPKSHLSKSKVEDRFKDIESSFFVRIEDENDCSRYSGVIIKNVEVKESPANLRNLIESFGLRPVNNIVDISNIILMTYGHPIHIFDLDKIKGEQINIRRGTPDEKITLLDGTVADLLENDLVISDKDTPIALAGVMGGDETGVTFETRNIFIESAWFNPTLIRKTSKSFGLKTDSSYLFERGADIECTRDIINHTIAEIEKNQKRELEYGGFFDEYPIKLRPVMIEMDKEFLPKFSGINVDNHDVESILTSLGFTVTENEKVWNIEVPSFRIDINGKEDLVEEVIRIYGYDKLTSEIPKSVNISMNRDIKRENIDSLRDYFTSNGFNEVINYSFHSVDDNSLFEDSFRSVEIKNPIGSDFSILRNSLIPGLLRNTGYNFNNGIKRVSLIEFGSIFFEHQDKIIEKEMVSFSASGEYLPQSWFNKEEKKFDFFIFKSLIISYLKKSRLEVELVSLDIENSFLEEDSGFKVLINKKDTGIIGVLNKKVKDHYKIDDDIFVCELELKNIFESLEIKKFNPWNKFPYSQRDLSFFIDKTIKYSTIKKKIDEIKITILESYELVDIFKGKNIPADKVSMLMSFKYRSSEKTLTNEDVNITHNELIEKLIRDLKIIPR